MQNSEKIFGELQTLIHDLFEVPKDDIRLESRLYEDLGLDSIDAIDLIGQFQAIVGQRINPEHFKSVVTVEDVVNAAEAIFVDRRENA